MKKITAIVMLSFAAAQVHAGSPRVPCDSEAARFCYNGDGQPKSKGWKIRAPDGKDILTCDNEVVSGMSVDTLDEQKTCRPLVWVSDADKAAAATKRIIR